MTTPKSAHTPGPWIISGISMDDGAISVSYEPHRIVVACVTNAASFGDFIAASMKGRRDFGSPDTAVTQWANAHLIAAAPDMAETLATINRIASPNPERTFDTAISNLAIIADLARSALSKASSHIPAIKEKV